VPRSGANNDLYKIQLVIKFITDVSNVTLNCTLGSSIFIAPYIGAFGAIGIKKTLPTAVECVTHNVLSRNSREFVPDNPRACTSLSFDSKEVWKKQYSGRYLRVV